MSPNRDAISRISSKRIILNSRSRDSKIRISSFKKVNHVTVMPTVFENGDVTPPLVVIEGKSIQYRIIDANNRYEKETIFDCLPDGALVNTRENVTNVDSKKFAH